MIQGVRFLIQSIRFFQQIGVFSKIWSIAIISFLFLLSACHTAFQVNNKLHSSRSSVTEEHTGEIVDQTNNKNDLYTTLGATYHSRILQTYGGQYYNPKLEHMLAKIVNRLTAASQNPDQTYHVTILDTENINAFALPGSYIYVTRGMLALANDTSEVAAILAHEIAHITANHGILRLQKEIELKLADHAATNILEHSSTKLHNILKDKKQLAQFTRSQELQADSIGIEMLNQAGYDPFAFPRFLKSMEAYSDFRNSASSTNVSLDFLATHPTTPQRIQLAIKKLMKSVHLTLEKPIVIVF
ncbi:Peptidase family M48 [Bartonella sp. WD12.1]|nr:Peptidase family M48 [Bartonella sp. WD12.1]